MSFCIVLSTKCGIVLAAESRGNIFDKENLHQKKMAYYDTEEKLFVSKKYKFGIGSTGSGLMKNVFFAALMKDFIRRLESLESIENIDIREVLGIFINKYVPDFVPELINEVKGQKLFAAGFLENAPFLCWFNQEQEPQFGHIQGYGVVESAKSPLGVPDFETMTLEEAIKYAEGTIKSYAKKGDRWKTIGGPIDVLILQPTTFWWERIHKKHGCKYSSEFITKIRNGKIRLELIKPYTQQDINDLFDT